MSTTDRTDAIPASPPHRLAERLGDLRQLDGTAEAVAHAVDGALRDPARKAAVRGDWLGHRLHPLMTDAVVGSWISAAVLDVLGGDKVAPRRLIATGLLAVPPTVITGLNDFTDSNPRDRRIALVHAGLNTVGSGLYIASWLQRGRGHHGRGKLLSFAGLGVASASAFLGGHLSFARGTGVDTNAAPATSTDG